MNKHPLVAAIEHKEKAIKSEAHPKVLEAIDRYVKVCAAKVCSNFEQSEFGRDILKRIRS